MLERIGRIDQPTQQLVVPRRCQTELRADGFFLRAGVPIPLRLEREDRAVLIVQRHEFHGTRAGHENGAATPGRT